MQSSHNNLWNPQEPGGSHFSQLHHLASLRGGETLHRLLQHQQHEVPGGSQKPPYGQGKRQKSSLFLSEHVAQTLCCSVCFSLLIWWKCNSASQMLITEKSMFSPGVLALYSKLGYKSRELQCRVSLSLNFSYVKSVFMGVYCFTSLLVCKSHYSV